MRNLFQAHKGFWTPARKHSFYFGLFLLALATIVQLILGGYSSRASVSANSVSDIFLDNLPVVNLDFMIVGGYILIWALAWWLMALKPKYLLLGTKSVAFYITCRAFFTSLTHIGAYPVGAAPGPDDFGWGLYRHLTFQGNFFFSGHTAFPFLMALIFWEEKEWRYFFLGMTVVFGAVMLLAHEHYSIDVFAAPFIVYGTYRIAEKLFPHDAVIQG